MRIVYENNHVPTVGRYKNVVVDDPAVSKNYLYDSEGIYVMLSKQGPAGPALPGGGLPSGGTTGQVLAKSSGTDYAVAWTTLNKNSVGLNNVDNTSDVQKLASPALTGTPTAPTASPGTNTTQVATTAFVTAAVAAGGGGGGGSYLPLTGGVLSDNLAIQKNINADAELKVQNLFSNKGAYVTLIANGGNNPFMSINGLSGAGLDPNTYKQLWKMGNFSSPGFSIYTNNAAGVGYSTAQAISWDYSQNTTVYGNILPNITGNRKIGASNLYFSELYATKHILNTNANIDGTTLGQLIFNGTVRIPNGAIDGYILTSDSFGRATWRAGAIVTDADRAAKGIVRLGGDLGGTADIPQVVSAHFAASGFFITSRTGKLFLVSIDDAGDFQSVEIESNSNSGQVTGLLAPLTYA